MRSERELGFSTEGQNEGGRRTLVDGVARGAVVDQAHAREVRVDDREVLDVRAVRVPAVLSLAVSPE